MIDEETAAILESDLVFRNNYERAIRQQLNLTPSLTRSSQPQSQQPIGSPRQQLHLTQSLTRSSQSQSQQAISSPSPKSSPVTVSNPSIEDCDTDEVPVDGVQEQQQLVWSSKKPSPFDIEATYFFLELRKKFALEFDDKKTTKNVLWHRIALEMNVKKFFVGHGVEATERCRKKFANLQSAYVKYQDDKRKTGQGKVQRPAFFDELDLILGSKDKVMPPIIIDSVSNENAQPHIFEPLPGPSNVGKTNTNKYENIKTSSKPDKNAEKNQLIKDLIDIQKKDSEDRKSEVARMFSYLETTAAQRHDVIMALLRKKENRKRKRKDSSSDTD